MRGLSLDGLGLAAGAALFGLAIFLAPILSSRSGDVQDLTTAASDNPPTDERWDGEWEHRLPQYPDTRSHAIAELDKLYPTKSISNFGATQKHQMRPTLVETGVIPRDPILRINAEQHGAIVWQIDVDANGQYLVTGSDDKTARVWRVPQSEGDEFELLRVLRPPIGDVDEGMVHEVSISPDGEIVAVSGMTGYQWDQKASIYLFDRESGRLIHRIAGLPRAVRSLAFSRDGQHLAAGHSGSYGISVYNTNNWQPIPVMKDEEKKGTTINLFFSSDGRLTTVDTAGFVRLYEHDENSDQYQWIKRVAPFDDDEVFGLAIAPDETKIAVTSGVRAKIAVLSADDLKTLYTANTEGLRDGRFNALTEVAWSYDSQFLFGAGGADRFFETEGPDKYDILIRRWSDAGRGEFEDFRLSQDRAISLRTAKDGILFASQDPVVGLLTVDGKIATQKKTIKIDMRSASQDPVRGVRRLRSSNDGLVVSQPFSRWQGSFWLYDVNSRNFTVVEKEVVDLPAPRVRTDDGIQVHRWRNSTEVIVNEKSLSFGSIERARAIAITPDEDAFILAADFHIGLVDGEANYVWRKSSPGVAWRTTISEDGRFALFGFGDGTVRWYDMRNGDELLAVFVTNEPENPRWVAWTPTGYYDASPGAEDFIGWHLNQGVDKEALFFSADRFRDLYYRPDLIPQVLRTRTVPSAPVAVAPKPSTPQARSNIVLRMARRIPFIRDWVGGAATVAVAEVVKATRADILKEAPPLVVITRETPTNVGDMEVVIETRSSDGAPVSLEVFLDGAKINFSAAAVSTTFNAAAGAEQTLLIPGGARANVITIVAIDNAGRRSDGVDTRGGVPIPTPPEEQKTPNLYALVVGVSDYIDRTIPDLDYADDDAMDFAAMLKAQEGGLYGEVDIRTLTDAGATKQAILEGLDWLTDAPGEDDVALLFLAGHGARAGNRNEFYFMAHDTDDRKLKGNTGTGVQSTIFQSSIASANGRRFVFIDACYSDSLANGELKVIDTNIFASELSDSQVMFFASASGDQVSHEDDAWENGAFTEALLEGLRGRADHPVSNDKQITVTELNSFMEARVPQLIAERNKPSQQTPIPAQVGGKVTVSAVN